MWKNDAPPFCKQTAFMIKGSKTVSCLMQVLFRVRCSWKQVGGHSPPHLQTQRRYDGFWEGSYGEYTVAFELSGLRDLRQKQWSLYPHSVTVQYRVQIPGMWIPWVCYGSEPVLLRIRDRRTTGPEDRGTSGPGDQRTAGPEDQRPRDQGPGDHRATGLAKPSKTQPWPNLPKKKTGPERVSQQKTFLTIEKICHQNTSGNQEKNYFVILHSWHASGIPPVHGEKHFVCPTEPASTRGKSFWPCMRILAPWLLALVRKAFRPLPNVFLFADIYPLSKRPHLAIPAHRTP